MVCRTVQYNRCNQLQLKSELPPLSFDHPLPDLTHPSVVTGSGNFFFERRLDFVNKHDFKVQ